MPGPNSTPRLDRHVGKTAVKRTRGKGGDGWQPKKLAARIAIWDDLGGLKASGIAPNVKSLDGMAYRRPGSQNPNK